MTACPGSSSLGRLRICQAGRGRMWPTWPKMSMKAAVGLGVRQILLLGLSCRLIKCIVDSMNIDGFPFVGAVPNRDGHLITPGFSGHGRYISALAFNLAANEYSGMSRILLSTAHLTPLILDALGIQPTLLGKAVLDSSRAFQRDCGTDYPATKGRSHGKA